MLMFTTQFCKKIHADITWKTPSSKMMSNDIIFNVNKTLSDTWDVFNGMHVSIGNCNKS